MYKLENGNKIDSSIGVAISYMIYDNRGRLKFIHDNKHYTIEVKNNNYDQNNVDLNKVNVKLEVEDKVDK